MIITVDEYDKPLVNNLHDQELYASFRKDLTALYSNFKSRARYIRMVFLTGVSRFVHLSVLSGLNNLSDISFLDKYSGICGISEKELEANFHIGIEARQKISSHSNRNQNGIEETLRRLSFFQKLRRHLQSLFPAQRNGERGDGQLLDKSGIPTLLAQQLRRFDTDLNSIFHAKCYEDDLVRLDFDTPVPSPCSIRQTI